MTQLITLSDTRSDTIFTSFSRYLNTDIIIYGEEKFATLPTYIRTPIAEDGAEKSMLITKGVEYRPDLVSFDIYGIPDVWWTILEFNGMRDVWDFKSGVTIRIPNDPFNIS